MGESLPTSQPMVVTSSSDMRANCDLTKGGQNEPMEGTWGWEMEIVMVDGVEETNVETSQSTNPL